MRLVGRNARLHLVCCPVGAAGITDGRDHLHLGGTLRGNWKWRAIAVGAAAVLALGACSGDDDDDASGSDTSTEADEPDADAAAFCDAIVKSQAASLSVAIGEGGEPPTPKLRLPPQRKLHPKRSVPTSRPWPRKHAAQIAAGPQPDGAPPNVPSDEFFTAATSVGDYMADNCGYQVIDVTATDYAYDGIPADAEAGKTLIRITNDGTEYHEVVLQRVHTGETRSVEEILALPEEEGGDLLDYQGNAFAPPGLGNWTVVDLSAGRHAAMCFIPTGATPEAFQSGQVDDTRAAHDEGHDRGDAGHVSTTIPSNGFDSRLAGPRSGGGLLRVYTPALVSSGRTSS